MAVTKADKTGFRVAQREANVWLEFLQSAPTVHPHNALMREVFGHLSNQRELHAALGRSRQTVKADRRSERLRSGGDYLAHAATKLADVNRVLESKADANEALEYRNWLMTLAYRLADAGPRKRAKAGEAAVSKSEERVIHQLGLALGFA